MNVSKNKIEFFSSLFSEKSMKQAKPPPPHTSYVKLHNVRKHLNSFFSTYKSIACVIWQSPLKFGLEHMDECRFNESTIQKNAYTVAFFIFTILEVWATIPVTVVPIERIFSTLKRIKID